MAEQWLDVVQLIARAAAPEGHGDNLEDQFFNVWENHFPRFNLDEHFLQRLNERHQRQNDPNHQDQNDPYHQDQNDPYHRGQDLTRALDMNCVDFDRTTCTASFTGQRYSPGLIRSGRPLMMDNYVYFQIEIVSKGEDGSIAIGLVPDDYPYGNQPGWRRGSIGYHADDGGVFIEDGRACKLKEKCEVGDRMGCGIELIDGSQFVYFTRNGQMVAEQPFETGRALYPAIGMNSPGEKVKLCDSQLWDIQGDGGQVGMLDPDDPNEELDLSVIPQTGHISFYWKKAGYRDVLLPAIVPFSREKAFFEIEIFAFGENENISIGLVPKDYPQSRHPGWLPNSVGFHVAQGQFFTGQPHPRRGQLEKLSVGDKLGCGVEHRPGGVRVIYFTKNGTTFLEEEVVLPAIIFPAVGIRSAGKTVSLCIQDCDDWGYAVRNPRPGVASGSGPALDDVCARQSAIEVNTDACVAELKGIKGRTITATLMAVKPFSNDLSYFEIEVLEGESVIVGAVPRDYDLSELPGCHAKSVAYHSDDGGIYSQSGRTSVFIQTCSHGDAIGCGVSDHSNAYQRVFYFTVNGKTLWEVPFGDPSQPLYPAIGMKAEGRSAQVLLLQGTSIWKAPAPVAPSPSASVSGSSCSPLPGAAFDGVARGPADHPPKQREAPDQFTEIRKELECAICWNVLVQPKLFPCQKHSFCLACLRGHAAGVEPQGKIFCPVCRKEARLPWKGVDDFQDNVFISGLLDIVKRVPV